MLDNIRITTIDTLQNDKVSDGSIYTSYIVPKDFDNHSNGDFTIETWIPIKK